MNDVINPPHIYKYLTVIKPVYQIQSDISKSGASLRQSMISHYEPFTVDILNQDNGFRFNYLGSFDVNTNIEIDTEGNIFMKDNDELIKIATYETYNIPSSDKKNEMNEKILKGENNA